jgi:uncharacterized LabA/DUF88 family protein
MNGKFAILMDGGFVKKKLQARHGHFPTVAEIESEVARIKAHKEVADYTLLRVYFYDAPPASGLLTNPISGTTSDLSKNRHHSANVGLQQALEVQPNFALRMGEAAVHGWALGDAALDDISKNGPRLLQARDLVPSIEQKGVDLRIGLDIARLSLCKLADIVVVVTGDSDMIPAFKFARREGVRVYLDHMSHGVRRELKAHCDLVL